MKKIMFMFVFSMALCGYKPNEYPTVYCGSDEAVQVCVCSSNGQDCQWVWACV